ncbi:MAG: pyrimidine 5'-nucleotidase [Thermodesulfobacteriota bacterium]|nr:pyrimidine 5'-nucleotidase [Thermodesulfobacteriota bacterium]
MLQYILFDLDNTLYPKSLGIFEMVVERIRNYMEDRLGFEKNLARELRQKYLRDYGSTLRGLMIHQNVNPDDYLDYVHDVGVEERLSPDPALTKLLESIPFDKAIFTSGHFPHAKKVLRCLGVEQFFPRIFDIIFTHYIPKPNPEPYCQVLEHLGIDGHHCMMIEDLPANLLPAKELGMTTVLVGQGTGVINGFVDHEIEDILELEKVLKKLA